MRLETEYNYGNSQIIAQHDGDTSASRYFYLHDRLDSVRQIINTSGSVKYRYTYKPFGELFDAAGEDETEETVTDWNWFKFTGQYHDTEIDEYYLRARMYDPYISRFISRDSLLGDFDQPLTLHRYLYCQNDPVNLFDPDGASARSAALGIPQFSFEQYMILWNVKNDPFETNIALLGIWSSLDFTIVTIIDSPALKVFAGGAALIQAGPNMYNIAYYRLLQHGMINAIFREDFGISLDLYDYQDFLAGL